MRTSPLCSGWRDSRRLVSVSWKRMSSGFGVGTEFSILAEGLGGRQLWGLAGFPWIDGVGRGGRRGRVLDPPLLLRSVIIFRRLVALNLCGGGLFPFREVN